MRQSRRPIPPYIRNLVPSPTKVGMYDITWDGITYTMPQELTSDLANYFKNAPEKAASVEEWHKALPPEIKSKVIRQYL